MKKKNLVLPIKQEQRMHFNEAFFHSIVIGGRWNYFLIDMTFIYISIDRIEYGKTQLYQRSWA